MSVLTGQSPDVKRLLEAIGAPDNCISLDLRIAAGDIAIVTCEYYLDERVLSEDGELETVLKQYVLVEREDDGV